MSNSIFRWLRGLLERLSVLFRREKFESDLDEELQFHLEESTRRNIERGMTPKDAHLAARRSLGRDDKTKERVRKETGVGSLIRVVGTSMLDFKLGIRMLVKYPGLTVVGVLGMAIAIGVGAAFFDFINAGMRTIEPPLDAVVTIRNFNINTQRRGPPSLRDYVNWRDGLESVEDLGAFRTIERKLTAANGGGEPIVGAEVTASAFRLIPTPPILGRPLIEEDERVGASPVVVIGYDVWRTRFLSDPDVIGKNLRVGFSLFTVVGVMPQGYEFPVYHNFWIPLSSELSGFTRGQEPLVELFGRLKPGITIDIAQTELATFNMREAAAHTEIYESIRPYFHSYTRRHAGFDEEESNSMAFVEFFFTLILLVPCANVAILVYARTAMRQNEIAVRSALGASRRRIVAQLFVEALVLSMVAAVVAFVLASLGTTQFRSVWDEHGNYPYWLEIGLSKTTLLYILGFTVLAAAVVGVVPGLQATGKRAQSMIGRLGAGNGMRLGGTWTTLIVSQVAVSVAILPVAVAIAWAAIRPMMFALSIDADEYLTATVEMHYDPLPGSDSENYLREFRTRYGTLWTELEERLEAEPAVSGVTYSSSLLGMDDSHPFEVEGVLPPPGENTHWIRYNGVATDFFDVFQLPIVAGRSFDLADLDSASNAVIVNMEFVRRVLGTGNAIGKRIRHLPGGGNQAGRWLEVVGVVNDDAFKMGTAWDNVGRFYKSVLPESVSPTLMVRVLPNTRQFAGTLREIGAEVDPQLHLNRLQTLEERIQRGPIRTIQLLVIWTVSASTLSVLLLAAAGIYALSSFAVTRRRREIGIRIALGASKNHVLKSIFSRAVLQLTCGIVLGVTIAIPLLRNLPLEDFEGLFFYIPDRLSVLLPVVAIMILVGLTGVIGPARRGLGVEPTEALREE